MAARCYGCLEIPAEREKELHARFNIACWDRMPEDEDFPMGQRRPLRAVVKELVLKDPPLTGKLLSKMKGDLIKVRQVGIFPMDIVQRNYKGGLLVDFDIVMTEPHYIFDIKKGRQLERFQRRDMGMFQEMIDQSGVKTTVRAVRNREYCSRLRSEKKRLKRLERN